MLFILRKDYDNNKLVPTILQLPKHSHLVLDETELEEGQLNDKGILNILCLINLIKFQKLQYDFKVYEMTYDADIPIMTFSKGRSILPVSIVIVRQLLIFISNTKNIFF